MARRKSKKLSPEEEEEMLYEMDRYQNIKAESESQRLFNNISIKISNLSPGQKNLVKQIKDKEIVFCTGMAGCLTKNEKIKIYKMRTK
jgi:phosphate starvation-inducible protein PhoH